MLDLRGKSDIGDRINTQVIAPLVQANTSCIPSFCKPSDHAKDLSIHPLFHEHAAERRHQRTNPILGPIGALLKQVWVG